MPKNKSNIIPIPVAPWRKSLEEFRSSGNLECYLTALRLALNSKVAVEECKSTFEQFQAPFCSSGVDLFVQELYELRIRAPLARFKPPPVRVDDPEIKRHSENLRKAAQEYVSEAKRLAESHRSRYAGFWPATRLSSVYSALGEYDPGLIIASYLKRLATPDFPLAASGHLVEDDALVEHLLNVFLAAAEIWNEPEPRISICNLLVLFMLGCLPALDPKTFPGAALFSSDEVRYRKLLKQIKVSKKELPMALASGVVRRICEDSDELFTGDDSEDYRILLALLDLPVDFSNRTQVASDQRGIDAELIPPSLFALGFALRDVRISAEPESAELLTVWKRLEKILSYGIKEAEVFSYTYAELAEAATGILFGIEGFELLEKPAADIAEWLPLFPMLLSGYKNDWAFFAYGDERNHEDAVVLKIFLSLHDAAVKEGFIDLAVALLSCSVIELSVLGEQPMVLASAEFVTRARSALSGRNAESFYAALRLAQVALEQRDMQFAVRWISQPDLAGQDIDGGSVFVNDIRATPWSTLTMQTRSQMDAWLREFLPANVRETLGEDAWDFLVDAELQWSSVHRHFATPEQTDWGALVVSYFKVIEQPIVKRYASIFENSDVRAFCEDERIDIGRSTSIGQVRAFFAKKLRYPPVIVDLLRERRLAIQDKKELVGEIADFIRLRNIAAHGTAKVTAEQFTKFKVRYYTSLPEIASGLG